MTDPDYAYLEEVSAIGALTALLERARRDAS
jgi:hypothetical protein